MKAANMCVIAAMAVVLGIGATQSIAKADMVYGLSVGAGRGSIGGTITTDGLVNAPLATGDIVSFDLTLFDGFGLIEITRANGRFVIHGTGLEATSAGLFFDFSSPGNVDIGGSQGFVTGDACFQGTTAQAGCDGVFTLFGASFVGVAVTFVVSLSPMTGNVQIGTANVPGPVAGAGLPFVGGVLLVLGWWRRKRKSVAAA